MLVPDPGDAMLVGEKLAVTPAGNPVTESAIADLNPLLTAVVIVIGAGVPGFKLALVALGVSVNVGEATVSANSAERVRFPPVPVNVRV